jgi:hypothetical protein
MEEEQTQQQITVRQREITTARIIMGVILCDAFSSSTSVHECVRWCIFMHEEANEMTVKVGVGASFRVRVKVRVGAIIYTPS